ncbi:MAG: hypothetical protein IPP19_15745 [Verrucomicrobia bacterium]|nr:hypothetical protein [Verrucomicrobiota bacterium]
MLLIFEVMVRYLFGGDADDVGLSEGQFLVGRDVVGQGMMPAMERSPERFALEIAARIIMSSRSPSDDG